MASSVDEVDKGGFCWKIHVNKERLESTQKKSLAFESSVTSRRGEGLFVAPNPGKREFSSALNRGASFEKVLSREETFFLIVRRENAQMSNHFFT